MLSRSFFQLFWAILILLPACKPPKPADNPLPTQPKSTILIANEGNFGWGNAAISSYDSISQTVIKDVFQPANNRPLGDVLQSLTKIGSYLWAVVNNSGKIEIIDSQNFKSINTIQSLKSPRFLLPVNSKAYLTDFKENAISIIDVNQQKIVQKIPFPGWSEQMLLYRNIIWITAPQKKYLYLLDTLTNAIQDSILLSTGGNSLVMDSQNQIWVLCEGDIQGTENPVLYVINPDNKQIVKKFIFEKSTTSHPKCLATTTDKNYLYFFNKHLFRLFLSDSALPAQPIVTNNGGEWYGLNVHPISGNLFISNAIDYVQPGKIEIYTPNGEFVNSFKVGVLPNGIIF